MSALSPVELVPVADRRGIERFIRLPNALMRGDPAWVPPLLLERREALSPAKNPWFRHAEAAFWIAQRDGRDVGRISAQDDRLVPEVEGGRPAHFGLLAAEDDPEVFAALLGTAEGWARGRGRKQLLGPFSLSINDQTGLLVSGFDTPPMMMMPHDPPYAGAQLEALGYAKARDVLAYISDVTEALPPAAARVVSRGLPAGVSLRPMRRAALAQEVEALIGIFNEAWAGNWGFTPFTAEEVAHLASELKPLLDERLVWFAEMGGRPVAFAVCLPNLNEAIRDLGGRLLPFGWAKLLWRLKVSGVTTARVPLMGVRPGLQAGLLGRVLPLFLVEALRREARAMGIRQVEMSWVLEDNRPMRNLAEALGARAYKTYRVYGKSL
ncbi:GNAT family N-acetyltransferase [Roseomonas populi]|uniref:dATP pyrophosphohydrolase n=1 Tax=Roseomonas populi TaxID=3121582 RepID=A0ABT1X030_9PROT|nr:dATP pyrophosphohydrolase [Roseomonas pecuniae]MCR0981084.1 dATP pyrophosphohydrolase [Roseomonas pecuniae]